MLFVDSLYQLWKVCGSHSCNWRQKGGTIAVLPLELVEEFHYYKMIKVSIDESGSCYP